MDNWTITDNIRDGSGSLDQSSGEVPPLDQQLGNSRDPGPPASSFATAPGLSWQQIYARLLLNQDDFTAYEALWRRVSRWADRQSGAPLGIHEHREDVVAETCAATILGLDHAYGAETFSGFVFGQFLTARRRYLRFTRLMTVGLDDLQIADPSEDDEPDDGELARLEVYLHELRARERQAVELRYLARASSAEIARVLAVSETNARRIVFNGLKCLRHRAAQLAHNRFDR
jgi:RNA polymerase sigma factor (sigma-70 family)